MAEPWLALRDPSSHGFRSGFQCAEAHMVARQLLDRREEWGPTTVVAKLDIAKANEAV